MIIFTLTGLFNLIQYAYTHHTANNEDIYIAAKQCSQYTIGTSYIEVGEVFRYLDFDGEENSLILDNNRLVKTPGFEILLFHVDDVSFSIENDLINIHITRDRQRYSFLLTYAFTSEKKEGQDEIVTNE